MFLRRWGATIGWGLVGGGCIALPFIVRPKRAHLIADEILEELRIGSGQSELPPEEYESILKED